MVVGGQRNASAALHPGKRAGTHCIGSWVVPRAGLNGCGKSRTPPPPPRSRAKKKNVKKKKNKQYKK